MTQSAAPTTKRVLVAEDEAIIRLDLAEMLREAGYDVVGQAGDGEQAVEMARVAHARTSSSWTSRCPSWTASRRPR